MNWYQVITAIKAQSGPLTDLSTGSPLLVDEIGDVLSRALKEIADRNDMAVDLGGYMNMDGLPDLIDGFSDACAECFSCRPGLEQIVIVPGVQSALRYAHEILRQGKGSSRILYPIGLEFPGAVDSQSAFAPVTGQYRVTNTNSPFFRPYIDYSSLDWEGVGAVIISNPHSPTGCFWYAEEMARLADDAAAHGAWLILDETYALPFAPLSDLAYSFINRPNIIHLYSFSKVGLAGERVGLVVAAPEIVLLFRGALRRNSIQASKSGQRLALALIQAIQSNPELGKLFGALYRERWELGQGLLLDSEIPARIALWQGGPFLWCEWYGTPSSDEIFKTLLQRGVAVAPSSALWVKDADDDQRPEAIRIGLGTDIPELERAVPVIASILRERLRMS